MVADAATACVYRARRTMAVRTASVYTQAMKNITFSADDRLIEEARTRARADHTTLNEEFRRWLEEYTGRGARAERAIALVREMRTYVRTGGRKFTRDEMNER